MTKLPTCLTRMTVFFDESLPGILVALLILGFVCISGDKLKYENGATVAPIESH